MDDFKPNHNRDSEGEILITLPRYPVRLSALAQTAGVTPSVLQRMIDKLDADGHRFVFRYDRIASEQTICLRAESWAKLQPRAEAYFAEAYSHIVEVV